MFEGSIILPEGNVEEKSCRAKSAKFDLALKPNPTVERVSIIVSMEAYENSAF